MKIKCPCCQNDFEVQEDAIGAKTHCHHCGERFYVDARVVPSEYRIAALLARAQHGDKWSQCELGSCYENGDGVEPDYVKAAYWYRKAAEQGYGLAQYKLAKCYEYGSGLERDMRNALRYYRMAAEKGVVEAQIRMGNFYDDNLDGKADYTEASKWYRKAAEHGNAQAQFEMGRYCEAGLGDVKGNAIEWYEKSAKQGNVDAQGTLGNCYANGLGVEKDLIKALWWFALASRHQVEGLFSYPWFCQQDETMFDQIRDWVDNVVDSNDAESMYNIGRCYATGNLVSRNEEEALSWYLRAAEGGCVVAQCEYGECLLFGRGVEKDCVEAHKWIQKAADAGDHRARIDMSFLCLHGIGCEVDVMAADRWLSKAIASIPKNSDGSTEGDESEDGSDEAEREEAVEVVAESKAEAASYEKLVEEAKKAFGENKWEAAIELAKRTGPVEADLQSWMGNSYEFGYGVEKDLDEAFRWHKAAAEKGDGWSQYKLGYFLENGKGTDKNLEEAFKWYKISAENGNASGQYMLGRFYECGNVIEKNIAVAREWYSRSAKQGDADAQNKLEELENAKINVLNKALAAFEKGNWDDGVALAADGDMSDQRIQAYMGYCYEFGVGVEKNAEKAVELYKSSAMQGNTLGQRWLGLCYEYGRGTVMDIEEALRWYRKAAQQGDEVAINKLALLEDGEEESLDEEVKLDELENAEIGSSDKYSSEQYDVRVDKQKDVPVIEHVDKGTSKKKPLMRKAYNEMKNIASEVFLVENEIAVDEMSEVDDYLYCLDIPADVDEETLMLAANELFHRIGVLDEDRDVMLNEELDYCGVHRNEYSGKYFVLFNHPIVMERDDCGQTVKEFGEEQRARIAEEDDEEDTTDDYDEMLEGVKAATQVLAKEIKAGRIRSKTGEGYFVLAGEFYDAIAAGKKNVEYRDITPRNLAKSIGIKTVKFQRGYGHPGQPPAQMRFEVKSVALVGVDERECDPYNVPPNFAAMTIAIHLGKRLG